VSANSIDGAPPPASRAKRWLPLAVIVAVAVLIVAMGWHKYLTWKEIGLNYDALTTFIDGNLGTSLLIFVGVYCAVVAMSLPGAAVLTLTGGLLFGWKIGAPATVLGAGLGAILVYLIARTSLGEALTGRAGSTIAKVREGFQSDAFSYLLFLRLVPVFPFFLVNIAAAAVGVPLGTYALATFIGIIPATLAYSYAGAGLGSVVRAQNELYAQCLARSSDACEYTIETARLVTPELLIGLGLLGLVALVPVLLKRYRAGVTAM
jgi:uncharacterized membrane protein YdjX (TVP38/TMEM64 family)